MAASRMKHPPTINHQRRGKNVAIPQSGISLGSPVAPKKESCGPDGDDFRILGENKKSGLPTKMISFLQGGIC